MSTLGTMLREAREKKGVTPSEAALKIRLKVQQIEALESDDYSIMPAPVYAKGFIKMYAEYLGLEAGPLLDEYKKTFMPKERSRLTEPDESLDQKAERERKEAQGETSKPLLEKLPKINIKLTTDQWWLLARGAGILIIVLLLISTIRNCSKQTPASTSDEEKRSHRVSSMSIIKQPPEPYVTDVLKKAE